MKKRDLPLCVCGHRSERHEHGSVSWPKPWGGGACDDCECGELLHPLELLADMMLLPRDEDQAA